MENENSCVLCGLSVLRRRKHILTQLLLERYTDHVEMLLQEVIPREIPLNGTRSVCHPCWLRLSRRVRSQRIPNHPVLDQPPQQVEAEPDREIDVVEPPMDMSFVALNGYKRASNTARRCIFRNCTMAVAHNVPLYARFCMLHDHNFYIPQLARVCNTHFTSNEWEDLLDDETTHENFNGDHVLDIINLYKWGYENKKLLDFGNINEIDDNELHFWTGVTKNEFNMILNETPSLQNRSKRPATVLGMYLTKLRTGEPDERLATKFNISRRTLERDFKTARECLAEEFMPQHLGLNHISREEVVARNLLIPSHFFSGNDHQAAILVCDGTYIYAQKSSNFLFQRESYSLHKYRNLLKPFLIVCTDGYILDVFGPYKATTSDATIMSQLMREQSPLHGFLLPDDVFILDRGFRDAIQAIEECGYIPHMPPTRQRREQLTTIDANKSRLITMVRWIVETINGRFKKDFKIFRHVYFNVAVSHMMVDFKITAAIINATRRPYENHVYAEQFVAIINEKMQQNNELAEYVLSNNLNRQRVAFVTLDGNDPDFNDFPQLTYEELTLFTLGSYHLRIARSYCAEHMRQNGVYHIEMYRHREMVQNKILIRSRIQSRHVRMRQYYTYILINPTLNGRQSIQNYYCSCIHGRRTVGSCAHIASVVYFLSWARHQEGIDAPARFLDDVTIDIDDVE